MKKLMISNLSKIVKYLEKVKKDNRKKELNDVKVPSEYSAI